MVLVRRLARTALCCLMAVTVTLSCFFAGNEVYVRVQARQISRQQQELNRIYHDAGPRTGEEEGDGREEGGGRDPRLAALAAINPDLVGWLALGGEEGFSAPVVQRDNEYYLRHDFYGQEDRHGAVFLDYRCRVDPNGDSLILYGHNMNDGAWFNYLVNYQDPEFVAAHPVITFDTLGGQGRYAVLGVFVAATLPQHGDDFDYHNRVAFQVIEEKEEYIARVGRRSLISTGVEAAARDELLTLSTCLYDFAGERLVVVARRLREGEKEEDFANLTVTRAANPEMPAIWRQLYG